MAQDTSSSCVLFTTGRQHFLKNKNGKKIKFEALPLKGEGAEKDQCVKQGGKGEVGGERTEACCSCFFAFQNVITFAPFWKNEETGINKNLDSTAVKL